MKTNDSLIKKDSKNQKNAHERLQAICELYVTDSNNSSLGKNYPDKVTWDYVPQNSFYSGLEKNFKLQKKEIV